MASSNMFYFTFSAEMADLQLNTIMTLSSETVKGAV